MNNEHGLIEGYNFDGHYKIIFDKLKAVAITQSEQLAAANAIIADLRAQLESANDGRGQLLGLCRQLYERLEAIGFPESDQAMAQLDAAIERHSK